MNSTAALTLAITLLEALPRLITASSEVLALINSTAANLRQMQADGRDPTLAEWYALDSVIATLTARINDQEHDVDPFS